MFIRIENFSDDAISVGFEKINLRIDYEPNGSLSLKMNGAWVIIEGWLRDKNFYLDKTGPYFAWK